MGKITGHNGAAIRASLKAALDEVNMTVAGVRVRDDAPVEWRTAKRVEAITTAQSHINEAQAAFTAWAAEAETAAKAAIAKRPVGSAAEESRRVADELRLSRMIDTARRSGTPQVAARDLAAKASEAYMDATSEDGYREAAMLAQASIDLGGPSVARQVLDAANLRLETPEQMAGRSALAEVEMERLVFQRDAAALAAGVLSEAGKAAEAVGDSKAVAAYRQSAASASASAKILAFKVAQETGQAYADPSGALPGAPTGEPVRPTDAELARRTHDMATGVVS